MYVLGIKGSIRTSLVAKESLAGPNLHVLKSFFLSVLAYSFAFELVGAAILAVFWMKEYPAAYSMYLGVFHSVSAFCTAGFGLFPDSLMRYRQSTLLNVTIVILSLAGGIGFFVLRDLTAFVAEQVQRPAQIQIDGAYAARPHRHDDRDIDRHDRHSLLGALALDDERL